MIWNIINETYINKLYETYHMKHNFTLISAKFK